MIESEWCQMKPTGRIRFVGGGSDRNVPILEVEFEMHPESPQSQAWLDWWPASMVDLTRPELQWLTEPR